MTPVAQAAPPPIHLEAVLTVRERFEAIFREWESATSALGTAIDAFMNDGIQTESGAWILSMSQRKGRAIDDARVRLRRAKIDLDAALDDIRT